MKFADTFGTNEKLELEGVWVDMGEGGSIKIARAGNPENKRLLKRLIAPHKQALRADNLPVDVLEKLTIEAMSRTILLDWKGIDDSEGKPLPYSQEEAVRQLTKFKDFRDYVAAISADMKVFQDTSTEVAAKN